MKTKFFLLFIIILAFFLRFYLLGNIPSGLTNDEAGVGWDAYSVLVTGKDQWNQFLPLHFVAFGDYPAPLLRYVTVPSIFIFGLNAFATRFPSALFGLFAVGVMFLLGRKLFNEKVGILSALLLAISPWAIGLSRITIEPNVAMCLFMLGLLLYFVALKQIKFLYSSALIFALVLYTYSAYVLFLPLVALALLIWNHKHVRENLKVYIIAALLFVVILIPNFLTKNTTASVRFSQVGITTNINSIGLINTLNDQRGACQTSYNQIICKIVDNKIVLFTSSFVKNYTAHFNINFLYNNGTSTQFSILPERGLGYVFELAFFILGLVRIVRYKDKKGYLLILLLLLSPIPDSLTGDGHYGRASLMLPFILLIEGLGLFSLSEIVSRISLSYVRKAFYLLLGLVMFSAVFAFWISYTTYFKNYYSIYSQYGYENLMKQVYSYRNNYDRIYISRHLNDTKQYVYYLFYSQYDPRKFQNKIDVSYSQSSDGWISINKIENIYFVQNPPVIPDDSTLAKEKILIISNPVDFPKSVKPVFTIKDKLGNILFKAINLSDLIRYNLEHKELILKENGQAN
jgi:4-amino-4-deoxy-L-arabinose transferase-like glycosyltransferase